MNNLDNPYINLVEIFNNLNNNNTSSNFIVGNIISSHPLIIDIGQIQLDKDDLLINKSITTFNANDKVILLPSTDLQYYALLCIVG